jgi:mRNA interferase MazF
MKDTTMFKPGDVVIADFPGVQGTTRRPAVVISTDLYQSARPDAILAILTRQIAKASSPTDYLLQDWKAAGLRYPTAFRRYLTTVVQTQPVLIGHLTDRDWAEVQARLRLALAVV